LSRGKHVQNLYFVTTNTDDALADHSSAPFPQLLWLAPAVGSSQVSKQMRAIDSFGLKGSAFARYRP